MNKRRVGTFYEQLATDYLSKKGITIIEKNFRCRMGEIDLIGMDGSCIVFIEVKYRKNSSFGAAIEAVTREKQKKICRVASYYCMKHPNILEFRYDIIAITGEEIEWIKNAFPHIGYAFY